MNTKQTNNYVDNTIYIRLQNVPESGTIQNISGRVSQLETSTNELESSFFAFNQNFENRELVISSALTDLDSRINSLDSSVTTHFNELDSSITNHFNITDSSVNELESHATELDSSVTEIREILGSLNVPVYDKFTEVDSSIIELREHCATLDSSVSGLDSSFTEFQNDFSDRELVIAAALTDLDSRINSLDSSVEYLDSSLMTVDERLSLAITDSEDEESDLDISDESGNVLVRFADGHIKVKYFDSSIANISIGELTDSVSDLNNRLTELDSSVETLGDYVDYRFTNIDASLPITTSDIDDIDSSNIDLQIADESGNVLAQFSDGHFKVKNFDSSISNASINDLELTTNDILTDISRLDTSVDILATATIQNTSIWNNNVRPRLLTTESSVNTLISDVAALDSSVSDLYNIPAISDFSSVDASLTDLENRVYVIEETGVTTSDIDSLDSSADLDIADDNGNVLVRFEDGHIRTKNFDSSVIDSSVSGIETYIDGLDSSIAELYSIISNLVSRIEALENNV